MDWNFTFKSAAHMVAVAGMVCRFLSHNRAIKNRLDASITGLEDKCHWRINMARPSFFLRWLRMMPFEAQGVLIDEGDQLRFKGFWFERRRAFNVVVNKSQCNMQWYGNQGRRTGNLYWAKLSTACGPLLFCADTGRRASREALADILRSVFPQMPLPEKPPTWRWKRIRAH